MALSIIAFSQGAIIGVSCWWCAWIIGDCIDDSQEGKGKADSWSCSGRRRLLLYIIVQCWCSSSAGDDHALLVLLLCSCDDHDCWLLLCSCDDHALWCSSSAAVNHALLVLLLCSCDDHALLVLLLCSCDDHALLVLLLCKLDDHALNSSSAAVMIMELVLLLCSWMIMHCWYPPLQLDDHSTVGVQSDDQRWGTPPLQLWWSCTVGTPPLQLPTELYPATTLNNYIEQQPPPAGTWSRVCLTLPLLAVVYTVTNDPCTSPAADTYDSSLGKCDDA